MFEHQHESVQSANELTAIYAKWHKGAMTKVSTALKAARTRAGLTQLDLADKAGVSQSAVSRIESGFVASPGVAVIKALAKALRCSVSDLAA